MTEYYWKMTLCAIAETDRGGKQLPWLRSIIITFCNNVKIQYIFLILRRCFNIMGSHYVSIIIQQKCFSSY